MTWILRLYPPVWRRRYGAEVAAMLAGRGFSLRTAIDLVAGAIDVWLHPSATLAAASAASRQEVQEKNMLSRILTLDCGGFDGSGVTRADHRKATLVTIGGTLVLTLIWMAAHFGAGDNPYVDSLSLMTFMVPFLFSMRYTYLKHRPLSVQVVFVAGFSLVVTAIMLAAAWVADTL